MKKGEYALLREMEKEDEDMLDIKSEFIEHIEKEKYTINALRRIIEDREELSRHQERRIHELKADFDKKLNDLKKRETDVQLREIAVQEAQNNNKDIYKERVKLERSLIPLKKDADSVVRAIKHHKGIISSLQTQEENLNSVIKDKHQKISNLQKQFDKTHKNVKDIERKKLAAHKELEKLVEQVHKTSEDLRIRSLELKDLNTQHSNVTSSITYHSASEINVLIKKVKQYLKKGDYTKAKYNYNKARGFYMHLVPSKKKKIYAKLQTLAKQIKN